MDAKDFGRLLKEHPEMLEDGKRFKAFLWDMYPTERGNVNLLITSHGAGVVSILRGDVPEAFLVPRIVSRLTEDYSIAEEKARWAAQLWVDAYAVFQAGEPEKAEPVRVDAGEDVFGWGPEEADPSWFKVEENDAGCTLIRYVGPEVSELVIPVEINGMPVTKIGGEEGLPDFEYESEYYGCFCDNTWLTHVVIPNSIREIGIVAFSGCENLISVVIPENVSQIAGNAFEDTPWLKSLGEFPIANGILLSNPDYKGDIVIPEGVTVIGNYAFSHCEALTSIIIPDSVTKIGEFAFWSCEGLTSILIPDSVTEIGAYAFSHCKGLTSVVIPNSITEIGINGMNAFWGCDRLTISAPAGSFAEQYAVEHNIPFSPMAEPYENLFEVQKNSTGCTIAKYVGPEVSELVIPSQINGMSVTEIGDRAFLNCKTLTSIVIPDSVTKIDEWAFGWCEGLASIKIPNSVTEIGESAFLGCVSLPNIVIPDSVAKIGGEAFSCCDALTDVTILNSAMEFGKLMFLNWTFDCGHPVISAFIGSTAEEYAKEKKLPFRPL